MTIKEQVLNDLSACILQDSRRRGVVLSLDYYLEPQASLTHYGRVLVLAHLFKDNISNAEYCKAVGEIVVEYNVAYMLEDTEMLKDVFEVFKSRKMLAAFFSSVLNALPRDAQPYCELSNIYRTLCNTKKTKAVKQQPKFKANK